MKTRIVRLATIIVLICQGGAFGALWNVDFEQLAGQGTYKQTMVGLGPDGGVGEPGDLWNVMEFSEGGTATPVGMTLVDSKGNASDVSFTFTSADGTYGLAAYGHLPTAINAVAGEYLFVGANSPAQDTENADLEIAGLTPGSSCSLYLYPGGFAIGSPGNGCDITLDTDGDGDLNDETPVRVEAQAPSVVAGIIVGVNGKVLGRISNSGESESEWAGFQLVGTTGFSGDIDKDGDVDLEDFALLSAKCLGLYGLEEFAAVYCQWLDGVELPVDVGTQKQLFIDDYIIGEMSNVSQQLNQPVKYAGNPIFGPPAPQPPDTEELLHLGGSVMYDEAEGVFKMWYEANNAGRSRGAVAYATSTDGINWEKPCMNTVSFPQWVEPGCSVGFNNFLFYESTINYYTELVLCAFKDAHETDPSRRYKMVFRKDDVGAGTGSLWSAFSPDGLSWTQEKSIVADADSFHSVMWDETLGKYIIHSRFNRNNHPTLPPQRQVLQSESDDFDNWSTYGVIMKPDGLDPADTDFYNMEWMPYEGVFIGFISAFHHVADRLDVQLAFSRDNRNWVRAGNREVFIPNSATPGDYDYGMIWNILQHPIVVGDEIFIYYNGCSGFHSAWWHRNDDPPWVHGGVIALAKLRLDGFVSADASSAGTLTTKKLIMSGDKLVVNADVSSGSLTVEILNIYGDVITGFSQVDCDVISSDNVRHTVTWASSDDLSSLKGQTILLKFYLTDGKLYSFVFKPGL